jgi:hypothetical protein
LEELCIFLQEIAKGIGVDAETETADFALLSTLGGLKVNPGLFSFYLKE